MFNMLITCYLFLGGAGGGALVVLSALECARAFRWRGLVLPDEVFARGWPLCAATLGLGIVCLLADLGRPDRLLNLLVSPMPSAVAVGAFALAVSLACAVVFAALSLLDTVRPSRAIARALSATGLAAGLTASVYTGVLLQGLASVLFWQTPFLPIVFALSSISCGVACVFTAAAFVETRHPFVRPLVWLARFDGALIALEAACLAILLALALAGEGTRVAAEALVWGTLAGAFWIGLAGCGLAAPFALERFLTHGNARTQLLWIAACLLVGGFALRWCMVAAGAYDAAYMPQLLYGWASLA